MKARDTIRHAIRKALAVPENDPARGAIVAERLGKSPRGIVPTRADLPAGDRVALFAEMAEGAAATVERLDDAEAIPEAVARYLRERNLPAELRTGADPLIAGLDWSGTQVDVTTGPSDGNDTTALAHARVGIAEFGGLVLTSGPENPTTLNFLPDVAIVVVEAGDIVGDYETAWDRLRASFGKGLLPRTVNIVHGPSRSGDIQQTLLLGAHGPRNLHILVVGKADGD